MKKRATLPKDFGDLIESGDILALKEVFKRCDWNAYGGYSKATALSFKKIPDELVCWLIENGADINATDTYKRTALHNQATSWHSNIPLFLKLGANIEAMDDQGDTPLQMAAGSFKPQAVKDLIAGGAHIFVQNWAKHDPLTHALAHCSNINIEGMAEIADVLLSAGTPITPQMQAFVTRIGETFEFHRSQFNQDFLPATDAALSRLYELFGVTPVAKRQMHDGVSPITVLSTAWEEQYEELWQLLVPSKGPASTVQGEVIRIAGRVADEIFRNGGANWDSNFKKMLDSLRLHFSTGVALEVDAQEEARAIIKRLYSGHSDEGIARLKELALQWALANPAPIQLALPSYSR